MRNSFLELWGPSVLLRTKSQSIKTLTELGGLFKRSIQTATGDTCLLSAETSLRLQGTKASSWRQHCQAHPCPRPCSWRPRSPWPRTRPSPRRFTSSSGNRVETKWAGGGRGSQASGADRRAGLGTRAAAAGPRSGGKPRGICARRGPIRKQPRAAAAAAASALGGRDVTQPTVGAENACARRACAEAASFRCGALRLPAPDTREREGSGCRPPRTPVLAPRARA